MTAYKLSDYDDNIEFDASLIIDRAYVDKMNCLYGMPTTKTLNEHLEDDTSNPPNIVKMQLKHMTDEFKIDQDELRCGFEEEVIVAEEELRKHYESVNVQKCGPWWYITFKKPIKETNEI